MKTGLARATIRVFEPGELAPEEKERLLGALDAFANLGDGLEEFLTFGKQNPKFFPVQIRDNSQISTTALPQPCSVDLLMTADGDKKIWVKHIAWEPVCHKLALFYRDCLRDAWHPPLSGPHDISTGEYFEILLGLAGDGYAGREDDALPAIIAAHPQAEIAIKNPVLADWRTGSFLYMPGNDFHRAVYILFREGWRAKSCERCSRRFIANKPVQRYCSTSCFGETKRERNLDWWNKHGKKWRAKRKAPSRRKARKPMKKRGD